MEEEISYFPQQSDLFVSLKKKEMHNYMNRKILMARSSKTFEDIGKYHS